MKRDEDETLLGDTTPKEDAKGNSAKTETSANRNDVIMVIDTVLQQ